MSVYGPNQVEELIIGTAEATETSTADFIASASDTEIAVLGADGGANAAGKDFRLLQKTSGDAAKNLNVEFSDIVEPGEVESMTIHAYAAEQEKQQTVTGFASPVGDTVYQIFVRLYNDGGTLSVENFRHISGSFTTASTPESAAALTAGLLASLQASLDKEGSGLLVASEVSGVSITVAGVVQDVVPGKITGRPIEFDVEVRTSVVGTAGVDTGLLSVATDQEADPGIGTGKYAVNLEWFTKGYKYEHYRDVSYPANFDAPYYADKTAGYSVIHVKYKKSRKYTSVENQHKVLTILVLNPTKDLAGAAEANKILSALNTATGFSVAALPVV